MQRSAQSCRGVVDEGSVRGVGRRGRFSGTGAKNDWKMCEGPTVSRASEPKLSSAFLTQILASPTGPVARNGSWSGIISIRIVVRTLYLRYLIQSALPALALAPPERLPKLT
jgi:hypothetical protein